MKSINGISKLEANILLIVWDMGEVTNREVYETFLNEEIRNKKSGFIPYTTIMSTMNLLVRKKILRREKIRRTYIYCAELSRKELTKSIIRSVVEKLL